jgi:4,5-DOPA dioxygenase extradiol
MTMPVLFVGHGSPMNALEDNAFTAAWRAVAGAIPRPRAILCVSAHWQTDGPHVTAMEQPRTIHDFYGFPPELFRVQYPALGAPWLAERVVALGTAHGIATDSGWGLDHGTWSVLARMYPGADVPVVQLALDARRSPAEHVALARSLRPLRDEGVLLIGSGNIVHNLRLVRWEDTAYDWALEFDAKVAQRIEQQDDAALIDYRSLGPGAALAVPTDEHYLPLLYALAQRDPGEAVSFFAEGVTLGSISMRSLRVG